MQIRIVKDPDGGNNMLELETVHHGGSESQMSYEYFQDGGSVSRNGWKTDYWGRLEDVEVVSEGFDLTPLLQVASLTLSDGGHSAPPKVVSLTKTCGGCPAQWEGLTEDGRAVYVRYRWGILSVGVAVDVRTAVRESRDVWSNIDRIFDGEMDTPEMIKRTAGVLCFSEGIALFT